MSITLSEIHSKINEMRINETTPKVILMNYKDYNRHLETLPFGVNRDVELVLSLLPNKNLLNKLYGISLRICLNLDEGEIEIY